MLRLLLLWLLLFVLAVPDQYLVVPSQGPTAAPETRDRP